MGTISRSQGLAAVVLFSLQFISQNSFGYFDGFGPTNAYNSTLNSNLTASINATNAWQSQQFAIQNQQIQAANAASRAQFEITVQKGQALAAGNFMGAAQLDMSSRAVDRQLSSVNMAAAQANSQNNIQNMQAQAAIQQSNMAALTQYSRVVDGAIYSAGMSDGETGRVRTGSSIVSEPGSSEGSPTQDASWFDPADDGADWVGSTSSTNTFPSMFQQPQTNTSINFDTTPVAAQNSAGRGIGGFESGTWFDPHDDGSDYYDAPTILSQLPAA